MKGICKTGRVTMVFDSNDRLTAVESQAEGIRSRP